MSKMLVLSYNTCDQAMRGKAYGSAKSLGKKCQSTASDKGGNTVPTPCASNMANLIDAIPAAVNKRDGTRYSNYDFVGFQEASWWESLLTHNRSSLAVETLQKLEPVPHDAVKDASMISFYDQSRWTLEEKINSQCAQTADGEPVGRPIQLLIFKEDLIFINIHNAHDGWNFFTLRKRLSEIISLKTRSTAEIKKLARSRIVMVGDYNEAAEVPGLSKNPLTWQPFGDAVDAQGAQLIDTEVQLTNPPITCNREDGDWSRKQSNRESNRAGDFIFDSASMAAPEVPPNFDPAVSTLSDHKPVIAQLDDGK